MSFCRALRGFLVASSMLLAGFAQAEFPIVALSAGMYRIQAELAHTPKTREIGLMNRESLPEAHGMVFAFAFAARHCMWMKNTLLPLSVAFLDDDGRILNIAHMTPHSEESHCASAPARYALEMNQGWFEARGIGTGERIRGLNRLPPPR